MACAGVPVAPGAPAPASTEPAPVVAPSEADSRAEPTFDPTRWLQVHAGSALVPVPGTSLLRDVVGRHWFTVDGETIERATSGLEPFLAPVKDSSGAERERRLKWVVGDAQGLRYAFVDELNGPCDATTKPVLLERVAREWRSLVIDLRDPSPPLSLCGGDFDGGFVLVDSDNSCGHGGFPFDYWLVTRGRPEPWPSPQRFVAPFMLGKRTFSAVSFAGFGVTDREEVVVFGLHKAPNAAGENDELGFALEVFRPGAEASQIVPVPDELLEAAIADQPEIDGSAARITLRGPHSVSEISYEAGQWSSKERSTTADDELFARLVDELQAHPLLVEGAPFTLLEIVRHAGLRWFSGVAGEREVTFVEGRARWKSDAEVSRRN